ncbi:hypothetical protein HDC92_000274 [Pedobacter sp. AK017]|uniref:hypothetical protein n=1 Tax=Pedobacter sp. AK017 TaxID=2723073 RepID=UPI00160C5C48|nr:hypothetical protein [Pedobacter sp. AK017]MBB5436610.1 hypothetical protein [Pedobacter sp. AK017]
MKKLFFAALVATVAVGGALSANAELLYRFDSNIGVECEISGPATCATELGAGPTETVYLKSKDQGQTILDAVNVADYTYSEQ